MKTLFTLLAAIAGAVVTTAAAPNRPYAHFQLERVAAGVFAAIATDGYAASNAAIVDLGDSTLVFDTFMTPDAARELRRAAVDAAGHDIQYVVNSHVHDDHVGGNEVFADVPILATRYTRSELTTQERESIENAKRDAARHVRETDAALAGEKTDERRRELVFWRSYFDAQRLALPTIRATAPDRTVDAEETLKGSARSVRLIPVGAAHTPGDLVAYVPDQAVLLAGDVVFEHAHPFLADGSAAGLLNALQRIKRMAPHAVVPGHGRAGSAAEIDAMSDYVTTLREVASTSASGPTEGATPAVPNKFVDWWFERFYPENVRFVRQAARNGTAAQPSGTTRTAGDPLDRAIGEAVIRRGGVGASVAVVRDGRVVLAKGYGRRSLDETTPVDENTLFAVGSVTKQFTSAAILLLAEDGRLSVDDKVAKYYPNLTRASDITLLDLMNHVSGYRDYYPLDFVDRRMMKPVAADALLAEYAGAPLDFEPGARWSYSNTGFVLLGRIVEKVTSEPFGSFLDQRIFRPLGMRHTTFEPLAGDRRLARGYTSFALAPLVPATPEANGWIGAAGGIWSTAADLAAWDLALIEGRVLKPASWALMTKPRTLANGISSGYGCGLGVSSRNGTIVLSHGGAVSGFIANNTLVPSTRSAVVVLINDEDAGLQSAIVQQATKGIVPPAQPPGAAQANAAGRDRAPRIDVAGEPAGAAAVRMMAALQHGHVDRASLGEEFNVFLTDSRLAAASKALTPFGRPTKFDVRNVSERGGMEVASVRFTYASGELDALMYRTPDGKIQEYLVHRP